jgi:hypothetical protein
MRISVCLLMLAGMLATTAQAQHMLYLKGAVEGTPCKVLEETSEYVLVRIPSTLVVRIEPAAADTLAASEEPLKPLADQMLPADDSAASRSLRAEIREQLNEEMEAKRRQESGSAVGQILWNGEPLSGCRIRVSLLEKSGALGAVRRTDTGFETVTDKAGFYAFEHLDPGKYKLAWVPLGGTHWVRKLRLDPDFEVNLGKVTEVEPLEVHVGTLN